MAGYGGHMYWQHGGLPAMQQVAPPVQRPPQSIQIELLGLTLGSRIEVRWDIVDDEAGSYTKWWGARIVRVAPPPHPSLTPCYAIVYDAEEGFEAEQRTIRVVGPHDLIDLDDGEALHWRREGERWEPPMHEIAR